VVGFLSVVVPAKTRKIGQPGWSAFGERHDVIDLESGAHVAARHYAGRVARFERGPKVRGDRPAEMSDTTHINAIALNDLHYAVCSQTMGNRDRDRSHAGYAARLAGAGPATSERRGVDVDVNDRLRCPSVTIGERDQCVGCIRLRALTLS